MTLEETLRTIVRDEIRAAVDALKAELGAPARGPAPTLTVADVAGACHAQTKTVLSWISAGKLKARKAGRKWVVLPADLERFLANETPSVDASDDETVVRILSRRRA